MKPMDFAALAIILLCFGAAVYIRLFCRLPVP